MKKLFQRKNEKTEAKEGAGNSFVGKQFQVGRMAVSVEDVIAEGGFALVFLVKGPQSVRYALKRMFVNNEADLACCKREIQIASSLNGHKNIIGFVDSSISSCGNGVYEILLLMSYYRGSVLQMMNERISSGFSQAQVLKIFCDICEGVSRLHHCQTPIIHRDIKVENILVSNDNETYILCDFGSATAKMLNPQKHSIAQIEEEVNRYTTLAYRSPEMIDLYSGKTLTTAIDIWALGCLLYKLCFFQLPFGESALAIASGQFTIPSTSRYSEQVHQLIAYCLQVDCDIRPDIYQVAYVAFTIAGKSCPIRNINKSTKPDLNVLTTPAGVSPSVPTSSTTEARESLKPTHGSNVGSVSPLSISATDSPKPERVGATVVRTESQGTSVAPRQRPKGSSSAGVGKPLPTIASLPLLNPSLAAAENNAKISVSVGNIAVESGQTVTPSSPNVGVQLNPPPSAGALSASAETVALSSSTHDPATNVEHTGAKLSAWNPFAEDTFVPPSNSQSTTGAVVGSPDGKDHDAFGQEFDKIRQSTSTGPVSVTTASDASIVTSTRVSAVDSSSGNQEGNDSDKKVDPFGAAPFNKAFAASLKKKHRETTSGSMVASSGGGNQSNQYVPLNINQSPGQAGLEPMEDEGSSSDKEFGDSDESIGSASSLHRHTKKDIADDGDENRSDGGTPLLLADDVEDVHFATCPPQTHGSEPLCTLQKSKPSSEGQQSAQVEDVFANAPFPKIPANRSLKISKNVFPSSESQSSANPFLNYAPSSDASATNCAMTNRSGVVSGFESDFSQSASTIVLVNGKSSSSAAAPIGSVDKPSPLLIEVHQDSDKLSPTKQSTDQHSSAMFTDLIVPTHISSHPHSSTQSLQGEPTSSASTSCVVISIKGNTCSVAGTSSTGGTLVKVVDSVSPKVVAETITTGSGSTLVSVNSTSSLTSMANIIEEPHPHSDVAAQEEIASQVAVGVNIEAFDVPSSLSMGLTAGRGKGVRGRKEEISPENELLLTSPSKTGKKSSKNKKSFKGAKAEKGSTNAFSNLSFEDHDHEEDMDNQPFCKL